jgi:hypothetical protein
MITHRKKQEIVVQKKKTKEIACGNESIYHDSESQNPTILYRDSDPRGL